MLESAHLWSHHDPLLVGLSVLVAAQGSYVSLILARELDRVEGTRRRAVLAGSAMALGLSIWGMHFIGMLAWAVPSGVTYDVLETLVSLLVAVLVVGLAFGIMAVGRPTAKVRSAAAVVTGAGIAGMHYIGMAAIRGPVTLVYDPVFVVLSVVVGICASAISLWLAFGSTRWKSVAVGSVAMGLAISGMHYTAMHGTMIHEAPGGASFTAPVISHNLLAVIVAVVAFVICSTSLLLLVPERGRAIPSTRPSQSPADGSVSNIAAPNAQRQSIEVETPSGRFRIAVDRIVAVHADGRYTRVYDGEREIFCNTSIRAFEERLSENPRFLRVHRSHIVQLDRIIAIRRRGDAVTAVLDGRNPTPVPVSRAMSARVKAHVTSQRQHQLRQIG